ncbi:Na+/H+ antiporter NhaC family protein [Faecalimicrobium sp. JNUCC 81]
MNKKISGNPVALAPLAVFILLFVSTALITGDFSKMPILVGFFISVGVAILIDNKRDLNTKLEVFTNGAGNSNVMLMCVIFLLAGAFGSVTKAMGGVESTVNFGMSILPPNLLVVGMFLVSCFVSTSMGTSTGTVVALVPIAVGISDKTSIGLTLCLGAIIGGAMFGDNLSMISDTTIAAANTQNCNMKDKFKTNFKIVLPAAILTAIIFIVIGSGSGNISGDTSYSLIKIIPYILVLLMALLGVNVFVVLTSGILISGLIGIITESFNIGGLFEVSFEGMVGMQNLAMISIVIGGLVELIKVNGGIEWLLSFTKSKIKNKKGAEFGIAALVSLADICTANNTISIIMVGPIAKEISDEFDIDPRKSASLLDIFSSAFQGIIPYGGQLLVASSLAGVSPFTIVPYMFYPMLMIVCGIISIIFTIPGTENIKSDIINN